MFRDKGLAVMDMGNQVAQEFAAVDILEDTNQSVEDSLVDKYQAVEGILAGKY